MSYRDELRGQYIYCQTLAVNSPQGRVALYNVPGIPYPFTGWLPEPMFASTAMALSPVTVVTNANRLRYF